MSGLLLYGLAHCREQFWQLVQSLDFQKIQWRALEEINAGVCDGMTYEEIKNNMPEEYEWMNLCTKLNCTGQIGTFCIFGRIIYFCIDIYGKYYGRLVVIFFDTLIVIFLDGCVWKIFGRLLVIFLG
ncbi:hypothetical protein ACSBR2_021245 [Camellia fascicularis]